MTIRKWTDYENSRFLAAEVFALLEEVYGSSPWSQSQIVADLAQPQVSYYLVEEAGRLQAFLALQETDFALEISQLAVRPSCQGKGLASCLLMQPDLLDKEVFLEVRASNKPALKLYQKMGFESLGLRANYYHAPVEDALVMKRKGKYES